MQNILSNRKLKLSNFQKATNNALSMFTRALNELGAVNSQIDNETKIANDKINEYTLYNQNLATQKLANEIIMGKINAIIEV